MKTGERSLASLQRGLVLLTILVAFAATTQIAAEVYDRLPRLEDELAYLTQARVFASGRLYAPTPPSPQAFSVPFMIDLDGRRFSKYPPGASLVLAVGVLLGDPWLLNPLLGALGLAVVQRLAHTLFDRETALWAVMLLASSPFFLMITASLMAHAALMLFLAVFAMLLLRLARAQNNAASAGQRRLGVAAGFALGAAILIRPYTTFWAAAPIMLLVAAGLYRNPQRSRTPYLLAALGVGMGIVLLLAYNFALTGVWRLSLYDLWWTFDRLGFGPDIGPVGFTPTQAIAHALRDLQVLSFDLHGVPFLSLLLPVAGLLAARRRRAAGFLGLAFVSLLLGTLFYHTSSRLYGPRYIYEAVPALILLSALGIVRAQRWARTNTYRRTFVYAGLALFFGVDLLLYLPPRLSLLQHLYDDALDWQATATVQQASLENALVFLFADDWPEAAAGLLTNDPDLQQSVIYARYLGPASYAQVRAAYPSRAVYFWRDGALAPAPDAAPDWYPAYPTLRLPRPG